MKLEATFLRSKVAYRIFILFILCALIPVTVLVILSFSQVTKQLNEQSRVRMRQTTKAIGLSIYERLLFLEDEMKLIASNSFSGPRINGVPPAHKFSERLTTCFKGLDIITETGNHISLLSRILTPPSLTASEKHHISLGHTLVTSQSIPDLPARIFMSRALDQNNLKKGYLLGEINNTYLWDLDEETAIPAITRWCILDQSNNVLYRSPEIAPSIPSQVARAMHKSSIGQFELKHEGQEYLASYWSIFLEPKFLTPKWTVVLSESKSDVLAPTAYFKKIFPLVILVSLLVVLFLSIFQIRRSLIPLEKLREGTKRIANKDFDNRIAIRSGDEFEELAVSFNKMSHQLGKQFKALTIMGEIDRAILSALDAKKIMNTLLTRMPDILPCDSISVTLIDSDAPAMGQTYLRNGNPKSETQLKTIRISPAEMENLQDHSESFIFTHGDIPEFFTHLAEPEIKSLLVLPIFIKERLSAIISLGFFIPPAYSEDDLVQARQLANQMAVALSNAHLIEELKQLHWGTLTALARTIDAKSHWTSGHSERVTKLALKIGRVLGLSPKELDVLHRGGLLHDTGKIGTPPEILDKPEKLTDGELRLMQEHVREGVRILEPIAAYADVIPIVLQHHEHFDGKGYPDGLSGEAISLGARIFAVADYFDALTSDRPYRPGVARNHIIESIEQEAGRQFDPRIVRAFLEVMAHEEREETT